MKKQFKVQLEQIKSDPINIDYFITLVTGKWGEDREAILEAITSAMEIVKQGENKKAYITLFLLKQEYNLVSGKYKEVIDDCLIIHERIKNKELSEEEIGFMEIYNILVLVFVKKGWFEKAITFAAEGLEQAESREDQTLKVKIILNTIDLFITIKHYEKTKEILNQLNEMHCIFLDTISLFVETAWAEVFFNEGNLELATKHCKKAYEIAKKNEKQFILHLIKILYLRAIIYGKRHLHTQAEKDFNESIKLAEQVNCIEMQAKILIACSKHKVDLQFAEEAEDQKTDEVKEIVKAKKLLEAKELLSKATQLAMGIESDYLLLQINKAYTYIYENIGEWKQAFMYLKQYEADRNKMFNKNIDTWLQRLSQKELKIEVEKYKTLYHQMHAISQIGVTLTKKLNLDELKQLVHKQIKKLFDIDLLAIEISIDQASDAYSLFDTNGNEYAFEDEIKRHTAYLSHFCMEQRSDIIINDGDFEAYHIKAIEREADGVQVESMMYTPLINNDRVIGAVGLGSYKPNSYNNNHLSTLHIIASYMAIAIKNAQLFEHIEYMAMHDSLTNLLSRRAILEEAEKLFKSNHKKRKNTVVMMLDLDYFKQINDKYGHQVGDKVLEKVGEILKEATRSHDYVGRYGGEEFLMVLDHPSEKEVVKIAKHIKKALEEAQFETKKEGKLQVTLSGGFYTCNEYTLNFSDAIQFADHALYRAKVLGRNRIISYSLNTDKV